MNGLDIDHLLKVGIKQGMNILKVIKNRNTMTKVVDTSVKVVTTTVVSTGFLAFLFENNRTKNTDPYERKV